MLVWKGTWFINEDLIFLFCFGFVEIEPSVVKVSYVTKGTDSGFVYTKRLRFTKVLQTFYKGWGIIYIILNVL